MARSESADPRRRKRRNTGFWIGAWLPVAVGICVMAMESTPAFGSDFTSHPLRWLFQIVFGQLSDSAWEIVHHLIRKTGHFLGYGVLGLVWLRAWRMTFPEARFVSHAALALVGTAFIAGGDEWHQTFLPNRTGSPWDVLLDCCGAISLCLLTYLFMHFFCPERLARTVYLSQTDTH
jgi:VanZ family protein